MAVEIQAEAQRIIQNLGKVIQGKEDVLKLLTAALVAEGSVLMEDVPGVGKTTLAKALAKSVDAAFKRIQFTPDLLPADILGSSIYNPSDGTFSFREGPIFSNVLLADEINRASPRTQSALLEAMSEHQATIEGVSHQLERPFLVLATQNPVDFHGTYPLPEAQLDRFLMQIDLGYPDSDAERDMLFTQQELHPLDSLESAVSLETVRSMQADVRRVSVGATVANYILLLTRTTRSDERLRLGVSPRGSLALFRAAQAWAYLDGRDYVLPDDVQAMAPFVLAHRLVLTSKARYGGIAKRDVVADVIRETPVPA